MQRHLIGEAFQIAPHDDNAEGHGNDEAHQHNLHEARVEHRQDLLHRGAMHTTDADFLAAVLRLEHHQAEHTHQRDDNGQNREQIDQLREVLLLFILVCEGLTERRHLNINALGPIGIEVFKSFGDALLQGGDIHARFGANEEHVANIPRVLAIHIEDTHRRQTVPCHFAMRKS